MYAYTHPYYKVTHHAYPCIQKTDEKKQLKENKRRKKRQKKDKRNLTPTEKTKSRHDTVAPFLKFVIKASSPVSVGIINHVFSPLDDVRVFHAQHETFLEPRQGRLPHVLEARKLRLSNEAG